MNKKKKKITFAAIQHFSPSLINHDIERVLQKTR